MIEIEDTKNDVDERLCCMCSEKMYTYNRIRIGVTNFYKDSSPTDNFIGLLSCKGKDSTNALVRFLKFAYKIRNGQSCEKHLINPRFCFQSFLRWSNNFDILPV